MLKYSIMAYGFHTLPEVENNTPPESYHEMWRISNELVHRQFLPLLVNSEQDIHSSIFTNLNMYLSILGDVFTTMAPYKYQGGSKSSINTQQ